jgi:hypothetical protein
MHVSASRVRNAHQKEERGVVMCMECSVYCRGRGCHKRLCKACVAKDAHFEEGVGGGYCSYRCESGYDEW